MQQEQERRDQEQERLEQERAQARREKANTVWFNLFKTMDNGKYYTHDANGTKRVLLEEIAGIPIDFDEIKALVEAKPFACIEWGVFYKESKYYRAALKASSYYRCVTLRRHEHVEFNESKLARLTPERRARAEAKQAAYIQAVDVIPEKAVSPSTFKRHLATLMVWGQRVFRFLEYSTYEYE